MSNASPTARIGHNGGPPLDAGRRWRAHCWQRAAKRAWSPPRPEVARLRMRQAAATGLSYRQHQAIVMQVGRSPQAVLFPLSGTLVRREAGEVWTDAAGGVELLPGVAAKLVAMTLPSVFVVSNQAAVAEGRLSAGQAHGYVRQVDACSNGRIDDYRLCLETRNSTSPQRLPRPGMVHDLLRHHGLPAAAAIMVGACSEEAACAAGAGLAEFIYSDSFFR